MKLAPGAACAVFFLTAAAVQAAAPAPVSHGMDPDLLFAQGEFEQARRGYEAVPKSSPAYEAALRQLGAIALYENHLGEADDILTRARSSNPADLRCVTLLAQTMNREGKFAEMAQLLRQIGRPERAAEFELFGKSAPYRVSGMRAPVTVEFLWTDPLPVVKAKVNNLEGLFLIDTGAPEIILDPEFARAAHVETAAGAGGRTAAVSFGRIAQFVLPGIETDDVPAIILSTRGLTAVARNKRLAELSAPSSCRTSGRHSITCTTVWFLRRTICRRAPAAAPKSRSGM